MNANFTILSSNINVDSEPRIKPYVKKSYVTTVGGEKIGVIGYTTKDTPMISQPGEYRISLSGLWKGGGVGHYVLRLRGWTLRVTLAGVDITCYACIH